MVAGGRRPAAVVGGRCPAAAVHGDARRGGEGGAELVEELGFGVRKWRRTKRIAQWWKRGLLLVCGSRVGRAAIPFTVAARMIRQVLQLMRTIFSDLQSQPHAGTHVPCHRRSRHRRSLPTATGCRKMRSPGSTSNGSFLHQHPSS